MRAVDKVGHKVGLTIGSNPRSDGRRRRLTVQRIALADIVVEGRLRQVTEDAVQNLITMAEDIGITTPIQLRWHEKRYILMDGAHRLEAARLMGLTDIAALVVKCSAAEARLVETQNNLGAARMTPLQTAVFVSSWKRDYYNMHKDRKPGVFKGNQYTGELVTDKLSLTKAIAASFGVSERTAFRALQAGDHLSPADVERLEAAPNRVTMEDLKKLAKEGDPERRAEAITAFCEGKAPTLRKALAARREPAPEKDPVEAQFHGLLNAFRRASKEAKRRFVRDRAEELRELLPDEDAGAGEVVPFLRGADK